MSTKKLKSVLKANLGPVTFGGFLRGARASKDMSQVDMAKLLGITKSTLCDIEKNRQLVSPSLAAKIASKCGLSKIVAVEIAVNDQLKRAGLKITVKAS